MPRIIGYIVGAVWIIFSIMAFRAGMSAGALDQPDGQFWWSFVAVVYLLASLVAIIGTLRYRYEGPTKV